MRKLGVYYGVDHETCGKHVEKVKVYHETFRQCWEFVVNHGGFSPGQKKDVNSKIFVMSGTIRILTMDDYDSIPPKYPRNVIFFADDDAKPMD